MGEAEEEVIEESEEEIESREALLQSLDLLLHSPAWELVRDTLALRRKSVYEEWLNEADPRDVARVAELQAKARVLQEVERLPLELLQGLRAEREKRSGNSGFPRTRTYGRRR